ncbi:MAG: DUF1353 domain-containing protein [Actinomycetota bacterium]|nr:DUF1353 domain-containing protein [Actinomycetota bacterium]
MPFWKLESEETPDILLKQVSPNAFQLMQGFRYQGPTDEAKVYEVPPHDLTEPERKGNSSDLASVPRYLWWFVASHGRHTLPALLHDRLVRDRAQAPDRSEADLVFRYALRESGVSWLRRRLMWVAVTLGTMWEKSKLRVIVFGAHLLAVPVSVACGVLGSLPWWLPLPIFIAGVVWGWQRWTLSVVGLVLLAVPILVVWIVLGFVWIIELVEKLYGKARGKRFQRPTFTPYHQEPAPESTSPSSEAPATGA